MELEKLFTLNQFVDLMKSKKVTDKRSVMYGLDHEFNSVVDYNDFLKQPLTKEMFVNPLSKPSLPHDNDDTNRDWNGYHKLKEPWEEAEKKVIFNGWKFHETQKEYINQYSHDIGDNAIFPFGDALGFCIPKISEYDGKKVITTHFSILTLSDLAEETQGILTIKNLKL